MAGNYIVRAGTIARWRGTSEGAILKLQSVICATIVILCLQAKCVVCNGSVSTSNLHPDTARLTISWGTTWKDFKLPAALSSCNSKYFVVHLALSSISRTRTIGITFLHLPLFPHFRTLNVWGKLVTLETANVSMCYSSSRWSWSCTQHFYVTAKPIMAGGHKAHGPDCIGLGGRPVILDGASSFGKLWLQALFLFTGRFLRLHWPSACGFVRLFLSLRLLIAWALAMPNATLFCILCKTERFILEHTWKVCLTALNCQTCMPGLTGYVSFQTCMQHVADCTSLTHMLSFAYCD